MRSRIPPGRERIYNLAAYVCRQIDVIAGVWGTPLDASKGVADAGKRGERLLPRNLSSNVL
jgi:hypothetical protein